ncbi:MAG: hypothetical protein WC775_03940 [Patescibacteria group bacterium]
MSWNSCLIDGVPTLACGEILFQNILMALGGIIFLLLVYLFFYGSLQWLLAGDDPARLKKAKGVFFSALLGLAIISSSFVILRIVGGVLGINLTTFTIPQ